MRASSSACGSVPAGWRRTALFSRRPIARAIRAVGPLRAGVEAWPPRPSAVRRRDVTPFSVTPMTATGGSTPGKAPCAIAPPSSSTNHGRTSRRRSSSTAACAAPPETSSSQPNDSHTSCAGVTSCSSSRSTASQIPTTQPLSSRVPRPQISPSTISAPKAGCCHGADGSTGTTSRWAISTTGLSCDRPGQRKSSACGGMRVSSSRSWSSGNARASSSRRASKGAVSTAAGSRSETVGMRTSAWSLATTRSCGTHAI